ncbi:hypothetical protein HY68_26645 [Streptomyces sp. AcH 505]|nr:hypothetical protein HY68_26645 [Streptomyces sp. AcH 505]
MADRPRTNAVAGSLLVLLAVLASLTEFAAAHGSIPRMFAEAATGSGAHGSATGVQFAMVVGLLCLPYGLPLAFLRPLTAGITVTAASAGSFLIFGSLTLAGLAAQLVAQYRLGRSGSVLPAALLTAPCGPPWGPSSTSY